MSSQQLLSLSGVVGDCEKFRMVVDIQPPRKTPLTPVDCYWKLSQAGPIILLHMA